MALVAVIKWVQAVAMKAMPSITMALAAVDSLCPSRLRIPMSCLISASEHSEVCSTCGQNRPNQG
jgi:hypothetical protein